MKKLRLPTFSLRKLYWSIGILALVTLLGYFSLYFFARLSIQGLYFFNWGRENSTEPVSLTVGTTTFHVPRSYLYQKDLMRGGKVWGFNLEVLLPDMTPYNDSLKYEFDECRGNCRRINIFIHPPAMQGDWLDYALSMYLNQVKESGNGAGSRDGDGNEFGLIHYREFGSQILKRDGFARFNPDGKASFYYECLKDGSAPSPGCTGYMEYGGLTVEYHHHRRYLANWQEIQHKVLQLLKSFEQLKREEEK